MTLTKLALPAALAALLAVPAWAQDGNQVAASLDELQGDPEAGAEVFERQCVTCHVVVNPDGETIAGRNARTGPNQWALAGRQAGTVEDFRGYSRSMEEAGEAGLIWNEADFVAYVQDPTGFLREFLDNRRARGSMSYRVRSEEDAYNVWAYLYSVAPPEAEGDS
jgi:cytochrome c